MLKKRHDESMSDSDFAFSLYQQAFIYFLSLEFFILQQIYCSASEWFFSLPSPPLPQYSIDFLIFTNKHSNK